MNPTEKKIRDAIFDDQRPWGNFRQFTFNEPTTVKILTVEPGQTLSQQFHDHRDELWIVLDDGLTVEIDGATYHPVAGDELVILRGMTHRLSATDARGRVLEIAFGRFDESDITRVADAYGRVPPA